MSDGLFEVRCVLVAIACLTSSAVNAQVKYVGGINAGEPLVRIVADPVRGKVYGIADNGDILFMDRATLSVEKKIATGRKLTDIDVSADGSFMTVLDNVTREYWNQPPSTYVLKFDLQSQSQSGITLVQSPLFHMALGRQNRITGVAVNQWVNVYQDDATTGAQLSTTSGGYFGSGSTDWQTLTLVSNPAGTRMFRTDIGISSIEVMAFDTSTDTITGAGARTVGSYTTEPVYINSSGTSLYVGDLRLNPNNLQQTLGIFPENIYAATGNDTLAFGANNVYDPTWGNVLQAMPVHSTQLTMGQFDQYLYAWDGGTNRVQVMEVPEPGGTGLVAAGAAAMCLRRRRRWAGRPGR